MSGPEWVSVLTVGALGAIAVGVKLACDKLDRIIALLEREGR